MSTRSPTQCTIVSANGDHHVARTAPTNPTGALAHRLVDSGLLSKAAIDALRSTDRHAFLPSVDLERLQGGRGPDQAG